ncbi:unnamed protein product [Scomber scombrus]|uniref:Unnamed protein product n=1 Tax=Scomber scombrus TaxID=13677 RepID=A0AAV1QA87_SCOSC
MEATYGPCSEHAEAVGIERRQRTRKTGESLHTLRDDIYERVSIAYADRGQMEQDAISVEIFTNALADAELVQKLLEEKPRTLARAYDIARRYEAFPAAGTGMFGLRLAENNPLWRGNTPPHHQLRIRSVFCQGGMQDSVGAGM